MKQDMAKHVHVGNLDTVNSRYFPKSLACESKQDRREQCSNISAAHNHMMVNINSFHLWDNTIDEWCWILLWCELMRTI